jgi:ABC-type phosphate/phosphonate transport system substrate-binding protein
MAKRTDADKTSIFVGLAFILVACIIGTGGILWKNFVEYTSNSSNLPEVFSGITAQAPYNPSDDPESRDELIFCFTVPRGDLVQFLEIMQPKLDMVVARTGKSAKIDIANNELEIVNKVERRLVDFGSIPSMDYVNFRRTKKIRAILERYSVPPKRTLFVVKSDNPAGSIEDIRGCRIAYRSNDSLSGYLVPIRELKKLGFEHSSFFKQEFFSENYSDSVLGLQNDQFDCAILSSNYFHELGEDTRRQMKIIHESATMPGGVYITHSEVRNPFEQTITGNMMKMSDKIETNQMFAGMFMTRHPDESVFDLLEQEYASAP